MEKIATDSKQQKKLYWKIFFILVLMLLLLIPNAFVQELINERKGLENQVQEEIASSWGPDQTIKGPVLSIPFTASLGKDGEEQMHLLRILPEVVDIKVDLSTEERKKSIYKTVLYNAKHVMEAKFKAPQESDFGSMVSEVLWADAKIDIGFSSAASLDNTVFLNWDNEKIKMNSGPSDQGVLVSAIHAKVNIDPNKPEYLMNLEFGINGSKDLQYIPCADNMHIEMNGDWSAPGFIGLPLPQNREVTPDGFSAEWRATEYNRPFISKWFNSDVMLSHHKISFGVNLVEMVGHYQKNIRSSKYALLIIGLSFLVFFFLETLKGQKIHPVQYIMIGLSLSIFYLLLLSFSEHVGFNMAYLIAALCVIILISWYSSYLFKTKKHIVILSLILIALYGNVFILLQMEEYALLVGSIGLFITLSIVMYLSKNMDWYALKIRTEQE